MKELKTDVVVIGGGTAGMAAVAAAAEGGAGVIALERLSRAGGTGNMASGIFAVESRVQRVEQLPLTREEAFKIYMDFSHWRVNARLVKTLIDRSANTVDWLEGMGVEFACLQSHGVGNAKTQHTVKGAKDLLKSRGPAATMMKILAEKAESQGARVLLKTTAREIVRDKGRITGVIAKDGAGEETRIDAKAFILTTGGVSCGTFPGQLGRVGDGVNLAREAGACAAEMDVNLAGRQPGGPSIGFFSGLGNAFWQPGLMVNLLGERFMNEEVILNTVFERNVISRQKDRVAYAIFDEDTKNSYVENGFDFVPGGMSVPINKASDFDKELERELSGGSDNVFVADSLEELAAKTGIDPAGLRESIDEYNRACASGRDDLFDKKAKYLRPVKRPPFYAGRRTGDGLKGWNGIKVNHKMEVLNDEHRVIPGLYAAGMDVASEVYHDTYPMVLPATAMGFAINGGRIAGENAAAYVKLL